jgi:purine nucleosidase
MPEGSRRVLVDTDTASDDAVALLMALQSTRVEVTGVTIVAGNVPFHHQVRNAKYTLGLVDRTDVPVYEGARSPLVKSFEHATEVHGEDGLGDVDVPSVETASAGGHAADYIVETIRDAPGEVTLLCIGPLTNVALAVAREPALPDLVDEVWVMGGAIEHRGNVTPAAEFNFWVDPDAARRVFREFEVTLVDWGLTVRDGVLNDAAIDRVTAPETDLAAFFAGLFAPLREYTGTQQGIPGVTQPDGLTAACMLAPELHRETSHQYVEVDEREGLTRGHTVADPDAVLGEDPNTRVIDAVETDRFVDVLAALAAGDPPESGL